MTTNASDKQDAYNKWMHAKTEVVRASRALVANERVVYDNGDGPTYASTMEILKLMLQVEEQAAREFADVMASDLGVLR